MMQRINVQGLLYQLLATQYKTPIQPFTNPRSNNEKILQITYQRKKIPSSRITANKEHQKEGK